MEVKTLSTMTPDEIADVFVLIIKKDSLVTRQGKPFYKVTFRDELKEVSVPVWHDSQLWEDCQNRWQVGKYYKVRGSIQQTKFGEQLQIAIIREANEDDFDEGFSPEKYSPRSKFDPEEMYDELLELVKENTTSETLLELTLTILEENAEALLSHPAAKSNHHAFHGGLLEHTLSVTKTAVYLAEKYSTSHPEMQPPLNVGLVVCGAALHDIGKLRELDTDSLETVYSPQGHLIGHLLLGRDIVRETAAKLEDIDPVMLLRLEHLIIAHQRLPEWGSPKEPATPEALLVHYADDIDAKFQIMSEILEKDTTEEPLTTHQNVLRTALYKE